MKGWRTLAINAAIVVVAALGHWATGVDWSTYVSPAAATVIMGGINIVMRLLTTTPVGTK